MVATTILVIVAGAALTLFSHEQPLFNQQQNQSGLNIAIRNAIAQLQLDVANAGSGTLLGSNVSNPPVAVTVINQTPATACNTPATFTYGASCFDQLDIIMADPNTPAMHPDNGTYSLTTTDTISSTSSPIYLTPPGGPTSANANAYKGNFHVGDELLLLTANTQSTDSGVYTTQQYTAITLTAAGSVYSSGGNSFVELAFTPTLSSTSVCSLPSGECAGANQAANDLLNLTITPTLTAPIDNPNLVTSFNYTDWVIRLAPVVYWVDTSNASNPALVRTQGGAVSAPCTAPTCSVVAQQVIGFKVGAMLWNSNDDSSDYDNNNYTGYNYFAQNAPTLSTNPGYDYMFWEIRSLQVSLIGRTTPNYDATYTYRNGFDSGPYQIESVSVVVNPRNLSFNNQ